MNEDKLILYFYNDGLTEAERREVAAAIESDPALATQYAALCNELEQLAVEDDEQVGPIRVVEPDSGLMEWVRVPADAYRDGYDHFLLREDVAAAYLRVREVVRELVQMGAPPENRYADHL